MHKSTKRINYSELNIKRNIHSNSRSSVFTSAWVQRKASFGDLQAPHQLPYLISLISFICTLSILKKFSSCMLPLGQYSIFMIAIGVDCYPYSHVIHRCVTQHTRFEDAAGGLIVTQSLGLHQMEQCLVSVVVQAC